MQIVGRDSVFDQLRAQSNLNGSGALFKGTLVLNQAPIKKDAKELSAKNDIVELSVNNLKPGEVEAASLLRYSTEQIDDTLQEMRKIALLAEDDNLSAENRLELQMHFIDLQLSLYENGYGMGFSFVEKTGVQLPKIGGKTPFSTLSMEEGLWVNEDGKNCVTYSVIHEAGDDYKGDNLILQEYRHLNIGQTVIRRLSESERFSGRKEPGLVEDEITLIEGDEEGGEDKNQQKTMEMTERLQKAKELGETLSELTKDKVFSGYKTLLIDGKSSEVVTKKIESQIAKLDELRNNYDTANRVGTMPGDDFIKSDEESPFMASGYQVIRQNKFSTPLGIMEVHYGDLNDIRLTSTKSLLADMFKKFDAFFKDSICKNLGWEKSGNPRLV